MQLYGRGVKCLSPMSYASTIFQSTIMRCFMDAFYPKLLCVFLLSINVLMFIASAYLNYNLSGGTTIFGVGI